MLNAKTVGWPVLLASMTLAGCGGGDGGGPKSVGPDPEPTPVAVYSAVIAGVSGDYSSSDVSVADTKAPFNVTAGYNVVDQSDYGVDGYGSHYYRIGRYDIDTLTKYPVLMPTQPAWQFSTRSTSETTTRNPYDLAFVSENKAYLIRYQSPVSWIINPSVLQSEEGLFKTGEIDLSAYDDGNGSPEASAGVIVGDKLFIVMQRLDSTWAPGDAYLAVFDTTTDTEIDTNPADDAANLKGIKLGIKNPVALEVKNDTIYVAGVGNYYPQEFTGGIESINVNTYAVTSILDDGDATTHPYGQISGLAIVSPTLGYFKGYAGWQSETLYQFNPSTGEVVTEPVAEITDKFISMLALSPDNQLWVGIGDTTAPHVVVLDTSNNAELGRANLLRNPTEAVFVRSE